MSTSLDIENKMLASKKMIKADCKMILNVAGSKDAKLRSLMETILEKGIVSGSTLANYYIGIKSKDSDFDIFIEHEKEFVDTLYNKLNIVMKDEEVEWLSVNEPYIVNTIANLKLTLGGSLKAMRLNIIFLNIMRNPTQLVSSFDFEVNNWFYSYSENEMFVSDRCIELIDKYELDFTDQKKLDIINALDDIRNKTSLPNFDCLDSIHDRLIKYINEKKFVMTDEMLTMIKQINEVYGQIWKL